MRYILLCIGFWATVNPDTYAQCANAPDLIIVNANIITMDPGKPVAHALAIRDGNIQAVGELEEMISLIPEDCPVQWIDARGFTILPGFNDAHTHWFSWPEHICDAPGQEQTTYPPLEVIMENLSMQGWTSISELNFGNPAHIPEHLQHAMSLDANGDLNVRLNGYWGTYDNVNLIAELQNYGYEPGHQFSDRIRAPGVKMYVDDPFGTTDIMDQATCSQLVDEAHTAGYQVAAHCVNQTAMEKILNAYEDALGGSNNLTARHRIEHAVKVSDDQMQRIKNKSILLSFQLMGPPDWPEQNTFQTYISNTNTDYILRWKDFLDNGLRTVGSTDAPFNNSVCDYSPFRVIYQGVTRLGYIDRVHAPWELAQRIAIEEGLKLMTIDGAWATKEENVKGSLKAGKYADLTIVSADPLSVQSPEELLDIHALFTMVGGEIEYCSGEISSFCTPSIAFRVDTMIVTVSDFVESQKPGKVFDLNEETSWVAGDYPPQYIQIDFLKNTLLDRIELVVDQFPSGFTRHQLLGAEDGQSSDLELLHEFAGNTEALQTLVYHFEQANRNFRYLRVATSESPSWVAWREIRIFPSGVSAVHESQGEQAAKIFLYPNLVTDKLTIELQLLYALDNVNIAIMTMDGKRSFQIPLGYLSAGEHQVVVDPNLLSTLPQGNLIVIVQAGSMYSISRFVRQ